MHAHLVNCVRLNAEAHSCPASRHQMAQTGRHLPVLVKLEHVRVHQQHEEEERRCKDKSGGVEEHRSDGCEEGRESTRHGRLPNSVAAAARGGRVKRRCRPHRRRSDAGLYLAASIPAGSAAAWLPLQKARSPSLLHAAAQAAAQAAAADRWPWAHCSDRRSYNAHGGSLKAARSSCLLHVFVRHSSWCRSLLRDSSNDKIRLRRTPERGTAIMAHKASYPSAISCSRLRVVRSSRTRRLLSLFLQEARLGTAATFLTHTFAS